MARLRVVPRLSLLSLICFSSLMAPSAGWGQSPQKILVLDPHSAFVSPEQLSELGTLLRQFAKTHPNLRPTRIADLAELRKKAKCLGTDNRCLKALGKAALAKKVLFSQIQKLPGRYMFVISLIDTKSGKQVKRARAKTENLLPALRLSAKNAFESIFGQVLPIRLAINANTSKARVLLNGDPIGQTPLKVKRNLLVGKHRIKVIHPDYHPSVRTVRVKPSRTKMRLMFNLQKRATQVAPIAKVPAPTDPPVPAKTKKPKTTSVPIIVKVDPGKLQPNQKKEQKPVSASKPQETQTATELPKPVDKTTSPEPDKPTVTAKPTSPSVPPKEAKSTKKEPVAAAKTAQTKKIEKPKTPVTDKKPSKKEQAQKAKVPATKPRFVAPAAEEATPATFTWSYLSEKWWFWTAIGSAVLVGVVTGTVVGLSSDGSSYPSGSGRIVIGF